MEPHEKHHGSSQMIMNIPALRKVLWPRCMARSALDRLPYLAFNIRKVKDDEGHEHASDGKFTSGGGGGSGKGKEKTDNSARTHMSSGDDKMGPGTGQTESNKDYSSTDKKTSMRVESQNGRRVLVDAKASNNGDAYRILQEAIKDGQLEIPPGDGAISDFRSQAINLASREKLNYELTPDRTIIISAKLGSKKPRTKRTAANKKPAVAQSVPKVKYVGSDGKPHNRHEAVPHTSLPKEFLDQKIGRGQTVALRYSNNIKQDIKRGHSYGEWGAAPAKTLAEAKEEWPGAHDIKYSRELGGFLPIELGLSTISSAWSSEGQTVREAVEEALENTKDVGGGSFDSADTPLYVLIGRAGKEDSNGYDTIREPSDYYRVEIPWKKKDAAEKSVLAPSALDKLPYLDLSGIQKEAARDYKQEYREYHGKPSKIKERAERNAARAKLGLKRGDPREADHKVPLSRGGGNSKRNLRAVSRETNRKKGAKKE